MNYTNTIRACEAKCRMLTVSLLNGLISKPNNFLELLEVWYARKRA